MLIVVLSYISLMISDVEYLHVFIGHLYIFFAEISIQFLCPFFGCIVCFFYCLTNNFGGQSVWGTIPGARDIPMNKI